MLESRKGQIYDSRHGWVTARKQVVPTHKSGTNFLDKRDPYAHSIDFSISGLGAYRSYRSHPGRSFPSSSAVTFTDREPHTKAHDPVNEL